MGATSKKYHDPRVGSCIGISSDPLNNTDINPRLVDLIMEAYYNLHERRQREGITGKPIPLPVYEIVSREALAELLRRHNVVIRQMDIPQLYRYFKGANIKQVTIRRVKRYLDTYRIDSSSVIREVGQ